MAIIIPSTGRPEQCARLVERIHETARTGPSIVVSVEPHDVKPYARALTDLAVSRPAEPGLCGLVWDQTGTAGSGSHVTAINRGVQNALAERFIDENESDPKIIIKLDDDHWPVTHGWDRLYLNALDNLDGTGVVYGNDQHQRDRLATAPGLSSDIVRELGWYAPPQLGHLFVDNFWLELGRRSGRLTYLSDAVITHRHPDAGLAQPDATYEAGGMSSARWAADKAAWNEITSPGQDPTNLSRMDAWAGRVRRLTERERR